MHYIKKEKKNVRKGVETYRSLIFQNLERERVRLLSKFLGDPTVEILRSKKESHFTPRGLRVGSSFKEFR